MAVTQLRADKVSDRSAEISYLITGESSATAARAAMLAVAPVSFNSLPKRTMDASVEEQESEDGSGNIDYLGRVPYGTGGGGSAADLELGDTRITLSTLGGSVHITQSLNTPHSFPANAHDYNGTIGVDGDNNVAGTDILTGGLDFTITKIVSSSSLTTAYLSNVLSLTTPNPHTNNATFSHTDSDGRAVSLSTGECLFIGMTNSPRGNGEDELRFQFKGSANLASALPNAGLGVIPKDGWEHLWVQYEKAEQEQGGVKKIVTQPLAAYVEQVYPSGNFGLLSL